MDRPPSDHGDSSQPPSGSSPEAPTTAVPSYSESQPTQWVTPTPSAAETQYAPYGSISDPYGSTPPPADPYGSITPPPSYPPPPGGFPPPPGGFPPPPGGFPPPMPGPGYVVGPSRGTNGMAIAALVCGLLLGPLGIIFGHISLSQIKKSGEDGRGMAIAGLVLGYLSLVCGVIGLVLVLVLVGIAADEAKSTRRTYSSPTTTRTSTIGTPDSTSVVIKNAKVGDCIHKVDGAKNPDGTNKVTVTKATCGTSYSTHKVTKRTTSTSDCTNDWVRTTSYSPPVVLCLKRD